MSPLAITVVNHDGTTITVPLERTLAGYQARMDDHLIYVNVVATTPARTPSHCRWAEA